MEGQFSVIRYIPDPARNEPVNVGVVLKFGEEVEVKTHRDAVRRAITSDPQADESALGRIDGFLERMTQEPQLLIDRHSGQPRDVPPEDGDFLHALSQQSTGKLLFAEPQYIEISSGRKEELERHLSALVDRLARPLRQRARFAPVQNPPRLEMQRALQQWIRIGVVKMNETLEGRSGIPRRANFYFENGRNYLVNHIVLEQKRESQLFSKAQSDAFEIEDIRRGASSKQWQPMVVCKFAPDRAEDVVSQVRNIFDVVECPVFDASAELDDAINLVREHLPHSA